MTRIAETEEQVKERGDRRMHLAKSMAQGISRLIHDSEHSVEQTDFVLILVDQIAKNASMVGDLEPERLLEVLKFQVQIIENAIKDGRFDIDLETLERVH